MTQSFLFKLLPVALVSVLALTACATRSNSPNVVRAGEAQIEQQVREGRVESVRQVTIQRDANGVGTIAGAVVGGVAGSGVGEGRGKIVAGVLGAVLGGAAGQALEGETGQKAGVELVIKFDNGDRRAIVQEGDLDIRAGDRVRVVGSGANLRVSRI